MHPNVHCSTIYNSEDIETAQVPTDRWMDKEDMYTIVCYSAIKNNEIMAFAATWMDTEIIILSEVSQTEEDKW